MQYTLLGRTGLQVSRLCLGTMNFGPHVSEVDSHIILDKALDLGINFIDTADVYGWQLGEGVTEQIVGRWFHQGGGRREKTVIATKVYSKMGEWPNQSRLSALHIRAACDQSLTRLKTDHIDLYQMHHIDRNTPFEEIWQAMDVLIQQGKILYVGSSNFAGWHIAKACETAIRKHMVGLVSEQCLYNLAARNAELEVLPACHNYGLGVMPWSPLHSGTLAGALKKATEGRRAETGVQERTEKLKPQLEKYEALCARIGQDPAHVGLAWLLQNPVVTAPIIGPRSIPQLEDSLKALKLHLTEDIIEELDDIFPGPGGETPEAWAW